LKTLVVSDQPLTVIALQSVLRRVAPGAEQLDATHLGEAMQLLTEHGPVDLMVLDLDTHGMRRVSGAALLRQMWPAVPMMLVCDAEHAVDASRSADIGVDACLLKADPTDKISAAFASVLASAPVSEPALAAH
jgi:DNA-binding NarL/FixJ family response regulator